jgi:hypothetical protein
MAPPGDPETPALPVVRVDAANDATEAAADKTADGKAEPVLKFTNANIAAALQTATPSTVTDASPAPEKRSRKSKARKTSEPSSPANP